MALAQVGFGDPDQQGHAVGGGRSGERTDRLHAHRSAARRRRRQSPPAPDARRRTGIRRVRRESRPGHLRPPSSRSASSSASAVCWTPSAAAPAETRQAAASRAEAVREKERREAPTSAIICQTPWRIERLRIRRVCHVDCGKRCGGLVRPKPVCARRQRPGQRRRQVVEKPLDDRAPRRRVEAGVGVPQLRCAMQRDRHPLGFQGRFEKDALAAVDDAVHVAMDAEGTAARFRRSSGWDWRWRSSRPPRGSARR